MAKISAYPLRPNLTGTEEVAVALNGQNFKFQLSQLKTLFTKADVGLGNVDNTADADKPVSGPQALALADKADKVHGHKIADVEFLGDALNSKSDVGHTHSSAEVDGLDLALAGKSNVGHNHNSADIAGLDQALAGKADSVHTHSQTQIDGLTDTLTGLQTQLTQKAGVIHVHSTGDINGLQAFVEQVVTDMGGAGGGDVAVGALDW